MSQTKLENLSILCMDDHAFMLDIMVARLAKLGISRVITGETAGDTLALVNTDLKAFDVLLCDLNMPDFDGIEFMRELSSTGYAGGVGIVSGAHDVVIEAAEDFAEARGIRLIGTLTKPFTTDEHGQLLSKALA